MAYVEHGKGKEGRTRMKTASKNNPVTAANGEEIARLRKLAKDRIETTRKIRAAGPTIRKVLRYDAKLSEIDREITEIRNRMNKRG